MTRVLVTGAAGFVGGAVAAALKRRGDAAIGFDLAAEPKGAQASGVEAWIRGSVTDADAVRAAVAEVDQLVHCAAIADLWAPDPVAFDAVNARGAEIVFDAARDAGLSRAVHVSSYVCLIAGPRAEPSEPLDERVEAPPDAMFGAYARSKRRAELAAVAAAAAGLPVAIVQPSAPIGPGDVNLTPPGRLVRDLARGAIPGYIDCLMNIVDVRSLADGILAALDRGAPGRRYLLTGEDVEMRALVAKVAEMAGSRPPRMKVPGAVALTAAMVEAGLSRITGKPPTAPLDGVRLALRRRRFDNARARDELGFAPGPTDRALRDAVDWMRAVGLLDASGATFGA